ncbi:MAG: hypothetical protein ACI4I2_08245 [Oscillospiraceae bacterium]
MGDDKMVSEKQKGYARKWDKENMRSISCRMRTEDAELFKEYCAAHNTTPGAVLKEYVWKLLEEYGKEREKIEQANNQSK